MDNILPFSVITTDRLTAAISSSILSQWGKYLPILEQPRKQRPDARIEAQKITNLLRLSNINKLIEIGLDKETLSLLNQFQTPSNVSIVSLKKLNLLSNLEIENKSILPFKTSNVLAALYTSLRQNKQLKIDENANEYYELNNFKSDKLVIVEDRDDIGSVIGINYASFINAHVKILKDVKADLQNIISLLFKDYENARNSDEKEQIGNEILLGLDCGTSQINFGKYKQVIFFSKDIPYGITISQIPTSHFPISPTCGIFTLRNLVFDKPIRTVLLVEPKTCGVSESTILGKLLKNKNVFYKILKGKTANPSNVEFHIEHLPFDLIIFSTHGGYPKGDRIRIEFSDPKDKLHSLTFRRCYSICPVKYSDKFEVKTFYEFEEFDKIKWGTKSIRLPSNFEHIYRNWYDDKFARVIERQDNVDLKFANAIRLYKENYFPTLHEMGNYSGPIIFANICCSYHNLSTHFLFGGARCYLGTALDILNPLAVEFANLLFSQDDTISNIVSSFNSSHFGKNKIAPYVYLGSPKTKIRFSSFDNKEYYISNIKHRLISVENYMKKNPLSQFHERNNWVIKMLNKELADLNN